MCKDTEMHNYDRERLDEIIRHLADAYGSFSLLPPEMITESTTAIDLENLIFSAMKKARLLRAEQQKETP